MSERSDVPLAAAALTLPAAPPASPGRPSPVRSIHTVDDVDTLLQSARALFAPIAVRQVSVTAAALEPSAALAEATAINVLLRHCGCVAGSVGGSIGLVCALAGVWVGVGGPGSWQARHLAAVAAVALATSLTAKFWSHVRARQRLIGHLMTVRDAIVAVPAGARRHVGEV